MLGRNLKMLGRKSLGVFFETENAWAYFSWAEIFGRKMLGRKIFGRKMLGRKSLANVEKHLDTP
jgi:hypothetical protein